MSFLTLNKRIESQSSHAPAKDVAPEAGDSAIKKFALSCHSEPQRIDSDANKNADQPKVLAEKLFLGRMGEIAQKADTLSLKTEGQSTAAWNKLFNPECFKDKAEPASAAEETLCLKDNIYGKKAI